MNIEEVREYCLSVKGATESFPFTKFRRGAENIIAFKVMDKMFLYVDLLPSNGVFRLWMKFIPEKGKELRAEYKGISPSPHDQGRSWNGVDLDSDVPDDLIKELIDQSALEVIKGLSKKKQKEYWGE